MEMALISLRKRSAFAKESIAPGETAVDGGFDWFGMIVQIARYAALPLAVLLIAQVAAAAWWLRSVARGWEQTA